MALTGMEESPLFVFPLFDKHYSLRLAYCRLLAMFTSGLENMKKTVSVGGIRITCEYKDIHQNGRRKQRGPQVRNN